MTIEQLNNFGYILTMDQRANLEKLAATITELEKIIGRELTVTSGLRSDQDQLRINPGVKHSAHLSGEAVDVADIDGRLYDWCLENVHELIRLGIYVEDKRFCPTWIHLQIRPTHNRFFIP
jgi:hypothetical protein